jgi:hypothetical protein
MSAPSIPPPPPPAQFNPAQAPKDLTPNSDANTLRRRGMWASIFTGPQGITSPANVTGSSGGMTGG